MQLEKLWQFMQADMEVDRFEAKMRQSEKRQTLLKKRNFLMEQQTNMKKLESDVAAMADRLEAVRDEAERLQKVLTSLMEELESNPPKTEEEANTRIDSVQKLMDNLKHYEQELSKMRKNAEIKDRQQRDIRIRAAKAKQEYDQLKAEYDVEFKADSATLKDMRGKIEAESKKVDAGMLERYQSIKQHCTPPMAKLIDGQCSGCFMSLPSATLLALKDTDKISLCDNCGRILYCEE
ncbi:MAG: hypothetical protein IJ466_02280 [Clostridia bacterium]|nr:hypothetical protein [Clostridia bacterium]